MGVKVLQSKTQNLSKDRCGRNLGLIKVILFTFRLRL